MFDLRSQSRFHWMRCLAALLVVGLILPANSVLASTVPQEAERFSSYAPVSSSEYQSRTTSRTASTYWSQLAVPIEKQVREQFNIPSAGPNLIQDPSFEAFVPPTSNPYWVQSDNIYGTPLCNAAWCGLWSDAHPHSGSAWAWFGTAQVPYHTASLYQNVVIPNSCTATLQFYFWIGYAEPGSDDSDAFVARVDGVPVFSATASQIGSYPTYTLITVDISSFANGGAHVIEFTHVNTYQDVGFQLDDVSLTTEPGFCISGNVGAAGAALNYTDGTPKVGLSDNNGNYKLPVSNGWSGLVTPSLAGVTFTPPNRNYVNVTNNLTGENYTASVTLSGNAGVASATINYTGGSTTADGNGNYSITVPWGWTGTVTPVLNADAFCPSSQNYNNLRTSRTLQHYAHTACPNFGNVSKWTQSFDLSHGWTVKDFVRTVGDVSGDGMADLVGFGLDGVYVATSTGSTFSPISRWTTSFDLSHGWTVQDFVRTVGDVSGDGKADLVGFGLDGVYVATSTGSTFDPISRWTTSFDLSHGWTVQDFVRTVGDVSGDGKADLVGFGLDGVYVATSTGSTFNPISRWTTSFDLSHGWTVSGFVRTVGDVNGDGKADLVGFGQDGVYVATSTGSAFNPISKWTGSFGLANGWTVKDFVRTVGDVNGDGKADIIGFGQDGVYIGLSTGTTFALPSRRTTSFDLSHGWTVSGFVRTVGDMNGGGKADLVGFGLDGVYIALVQ